MTTPSSGSDDGIFAWTATYVGIFAGFGQAGNRIIDVDGFANWGNPGSTVDYDTSGFIGGALIGKKFKIGGVPLRIELDGICSQAMRSQRNPVRFTTAARATVELSVAGPTRHPAADADETP